MKIEVSQAELLRALAAADGVAKPNQNPLLECVLITAADDVLVEATDLAMTISAKIESAKCSKRGVVAINAKRLRDVVKNAPGGSMTIAMLDNAWAEIKCGKAHYKIACFPGRDFPKIAKPTSKPSATFAGVRLKQMIDRVLFSASDDVTRMQLNGALFSSKNGTAAMVTTDGHRLSRATCSSEATFSAIIPKETLAKLARIVDADADVELAFEGGRMFAHAGPIVLSSGLIDLVFPPIEQVIPATFTHKVTVDRLALIASVERTRLATTETRGVNIDGKNGALVISSANPDVGEVSDEVPTNDAAAKLATCVTPKYLLEPLSRFLDDEVQIKFAGEFLPVVIEATSTSEYMALVMPMRRN